MVVIGIAAALMAIVVPTYVSMSRQHRQATCAANLKAIGQALAIFHSDYGCYPPDSTEYLWTPEAVAEYEDAYGTTPPNYRLGSLTDAAYHPDGRPFETEMHGLGLFTLYYLGSYASVLPPRTSDPRFPRPGESDYPAEGKDPGHLREVRFDQGYSQFSWFRGSGYITKLETFHCPSNDATYQASDLLEHSKLPGLGTWDAETATWTTAWNNYDQFYRRNNWATTPGAKPGPEDDNRNLWEAYPPVDTVVTWCPYHRRGVHPAVSLRPQGPNAPDGGGPRPTTEPEQSVRTGDTDLVLFVDGSVRRMTSREDNRMFEDPPGDAGSWPESPIM